MSSPTSSDANIGKEFESLGRLLQRPDDVDRIAKGIAKTRSELQLLQQQTQRFPTTNTNGIKQFLDDLKESREVADYLSINLSGVLSENHRVCTRLVRKLAQSDAIDTETVEEFGFRANELLKLFEEHLVEFERLDNCLDRLRESAEKASREASQEITIRSKSSSQTAMTAKLTSVLQWAARIASVGLVALTSGFNDWVGENQVLYKKVEQLNCRTRRFQRTHTRLQAVKPEIDSMKSDFENGPIQLATTRVNMLRAIQLDLRKRVSQQERTIKEHEDTIESKNVEISDRDAKIAELESRLRQMQT